jgi:hypothetical protein
MITNAHNGRGRYIYTMNLTALRLNASLYSTISINLLYYLRLVIMTEARCVG